jgi:hypothetical protein
MKKFFCEGTITVNDVIEAENESHASMVMRAKYGVAFILKKATEMPQSKKPKETQTIILKETK